MILKRFRLGFIIQMDFVNYVLGVSYIAVLSIRIEVKSGSTIHFTLNGEERF